MNEYCMHEYCMNVYCMKEYCIHVCMYVRLGVYFLRHLILHTITQGRYVCVVCIICVIVCIRVCNLMGCLIYFDIGPRGEANLNPPGLVGVAFNYTKENISTAVGTPTD